jgi:hypothetical protein
MCFDALPVTLDCFLLFYKSNSANFVQFMKAFVTEIRIEESVAKSAVDPRHSQYAKQSAIAPPLLTVRQTIALDIICIV